MPDRKSSTDVFWSRRFETAAGTTVKGGLLVCVWVEKLGKCVSALINGSIGQRRAAMSNVLQSTGRERKNNSALQMREKGS